MDEDEKSLWHHKHTSITNRKCRFSHVHESWILRWFISLPCFSFLSLFPALFLYQVFLRKFADTLTQKNFVKDLLSDFHPTYYLRFHPTGIVTRCPLELKMKRKRQGEVWYGKISYHDHEEEIDDPANVEAKIREGRPTKPVISSRFFTFI